MMIELGGGYRRAFLLEKFFTGHDTPGNSLFTEDWSGGGARNGLEMKRVFKD